MRLVRTHYTSGKHDGVEKFSGLGDTGEFFDVTATEIKKSLAVLHNRDLAIPIDEVKRILGANGWFNNTKLVEINITDPSDINTYIRQCKPVRAKY